MHHGLDRCWNQIGVGGDGSCPRLAAVGHCRNCEEYSRAGRSLLDREASQGLREDWSRLLAEAEPSVTAGRDSVIVFQVCGEYLALRTMLLERVAELRPVHTVPSRSGAVFTGLVNVDGELTPFFSAAGALRLGEDKTPPNSGRMLVLRHGGARLACAVDRVAGLVRLSADELETPPVTLARSEQAFTTAVFPFRGKRAGLLDGAKFADRLMKSVSA